MSSRRMIPSPMTFSKCFLFLPAIMLAQIAPACAQQLPSVEPPKAMPVPQGEAANLRAVTTEVLVPTLVEKRGGSIVYGLKASDFVLEDNGVPQKIRVQEEMDTAPVALVVAVEEGGASVLEFDKLAKMGPLLDVFLTDPRSRICLRTTRTTAIRSTLISRNSSRAMVERRFWIQ